MSSKQFYLLGESPTTAREVELPPAVDFQELQNIVASHFAIVKPNGKFYQAIAATQLTDLDIQVSALFTMIEGSTQYPKSWRMKSQLQSPSTAMLSETCLALLAFHTLVTT